VIKEISERLGKMDVRLQSIDEMLRWRFTAVENQVTILMRGHLEWEDK
jgi:hypothetical protein